MAPVMAGQAKVPLLTTALVLPGHICSEYRLRQPPMPAATARRKIEATDSDAWYGGKLKVQRRQQLSSLTTTTSVICVFHLSLLMVRLQQQQYVNQRQRQQLIELSLGGRRTLLRLNLCACALHQVDIHTINGIVLLTLICLGPIIPLNFRQV
jgi:hypothetical protein